MLNYQLTEHERIIKSKVTLNKTHPFFSYLLMHFEIEKTKSTEKIPTLGVNQYGNLYWNEAFVAKLNDAELCGVLAHEVMHVATLTFQREGMRDHGLWNIATDLIINWTIIQERFSLPAGVLIPDHRGIYTFKSGKTNKEIQIDLNEKTAEEVYDELMKHANEIKVSVKMDKDGNYEGSIDKHLPSDKDSEGKSNGKDKNPTAAGNNESEWKRKCIEASTTAKMRGTMSAQMELMIGSVLEPVIDWRNRLFAYITNELPVDYSMRSPSRRFISTGVYTPHVIRENLDVIVGVDVSGSIGKEEFDEFLGEVMGIADAYRQIKLRIIGWATSVLEEDDILITNGNRESVRDIKFKNCGGTDFSSFTKYCKDKDYKSRIYVILTDGYIESNPVVPDDGSVLFVLSRNGQKDIVKNFGEVCSLNDVHR